MKDNLPDLIEKAEARNKTPIRKKLVTDQKVKNIVNMFEPKYNPKIVEDDDKPNYLDIENLLTRRHCCTCEEKC